MKIELIFLYY